MDLYNDAAEFPARLTGDLPLMTIEDLRQRGLSTDAIQWRTRKGRLLRLSHGLYGPGAGSATGPPDLLDRTHAALAVAPPKAVVSHQTAALLHGFGVIPGGLYAIHLTIPAGTPFPQRPEIAAHQTTLAVGGPIPRLGVPCTPAARTAIDLARCLRRLDALPVLDAALRCGAVTLEDLVLELPRHDGLRGIRQARELVELADPRPECRQESQLRLRLHDARLYGFVPQVKVLDEFRRETCRIDLGNEGTRVGLEYDGMSHYDRARARSDRHRHNWLASRGWTMRYFTDRDLYHQPDQLVDTVKLAQSEARRSRAKVRELMIEPR